jgi:acyl dehydratase
VTRTDFVRYQGASGDFNPIHHDEEFARASGYPTVFAVGMMNAGFLATFVTDWLGVAGLRRFAVRFRDQVWPGDELTCSAVVADVAHDAAGALVIDVELCCESQAGRQALTGSATFCFDQHRVS